MIKKKAKKATVTIRLPKALKEQIEAMAKAEDRTVSSYVKRAIKTKLDNSTTKVLFCICGHTLEEHSPLDEKTVCWVINCNCENFHEDITQFQG